MAKGILAGEPLLRNDLQIIVQILEQSIEYTINHNSPDFSDFFQAMRTLAGLGFTAALADEHLSSVYQAYFSEFLIYEEKTRTNLGTSRALADSIANMIYIASLSIAPQS